MPHKRIILSSNKLCYKIGFSSFFNNLSEITGLAGEYSKFIFKSISNKNSFVKGYEDCERLSREIPYGYLHKGYKQCDMGEQYHALVSQNKLLA